MRYISVSASDLSAVGYDPKSKTLEIQFHNGIYRYSNVSESVYNGLMSASSHGVYFYQNIKEKYPYSKIG